MNKVCTYKIVQNARLIVEYYSGDICADDIIHLKSEICKHENYNPTFNLVHDFIEANFIAHKDDLYKICDFIKNKNELRGSRNAAYLTSKPNEVVFTTLFTKIIKDLPINPKTFSTIDAVTRWLNDGKVNGLLLHQILDELKPQPNIGP